MVRLIDKDALVAEIERLHKVHCGKYGCDEVALNLEYLEDFLNTLEVKEVDLEKEFENYMDKYNGVWIDSDYIRFAKHFFELGIKAQKGE